MRSKIIISAALATAIAALAFAPGPVQAHGDRVSVKENYMPGTIVIRTGQRRLYHFVGAGEALSYPAGVGRAGMQWSAELAPCTASEAGMEAASTRCRFYSRKQT